MKNFIGLLLWAANTKPDDIYRSDFYDLKYKLLKKYGQKIGTDIQHIKTICYSCFGSGLYDDDENETCWDCNGAGMYEFWTILEKYRLGKFIFHLPIERCYNKPNQEVTIEGYIKHKELNYHLKYEALLWLSLLFDRKLFAKIFGKYLYLKKRYTPMIILSSYYFLLRRLKYKLKLSYLKKKMIIEFYKLDLINRNN